ncbi:MAG: hypothetical protein C4548_02195 [Desulfobacteraceae bacterium]|jgi:hypothetical protein|nr:MAG: hypothetical protein C4548_02195 [Desulfobacteraceae bacterium]
MSGKILKQVEEEVERIVERFNKEHLSGQGRAYVARFRGNYLYLDRSDFGNVGPICRLKYTGKMDDWEFAIYKFTRDAYSSDEFFFPGEEAS